MNRQPPPRYVVQPTSSQSARRRFWWALGAAWVASLLLVVALTWVVVGHTPTAAAISPDAGATHTYNVEQLRQQVATLTRSAQVAQVASEDLKKTLSDREEEINGLRTDLAFYSHLVGGGAQPQGLRVQGLHLTAMPNARAWNFTATLTQNSKRAKETTGTLKVAVDGVLGGHLTRLNWDKIGNNTQPTGLQFDFKYFQQMHGSLILPRDFTPNRLHVSVQPKGSKPIVSSVAWGDALKSVEENDVQQ